jgi:hypothetical protein
MLLIDSVMSIGISKTKCSIFITGHRFHHPICMVYESP